MWPLKAAPTGSLITACISLRVVRLKGCFSSFFFRYWFHNSSDLLHNSLERFIPNSTFRAELQVWCLFLRFLPPVPVKGDKWDLVCGFHNINKLYLTFSTAISAEILLDDRLKYLFSRKSVLSARSLWWLQTPQISRWLLKHQRGSVTYVSSLCDRIHRCLFLSFKSSESAALHHFHSVFWSQWT